MGFSTLTVTDGHESGGSAEMTTGGVTSSVGGEALVNVDLSGLMPPAP